MSESLRDAIQNTCRAPSSTPAAGTPRRRSDRQMKSKCSSKSRRSVAALPPMAAAPGSAPLVAPKRPSSKGETSCVMPRGPGSRVLHSRYGWKLPSGSPNSYVEAQKKKSPHDRGSIDLGFRPKVEGIRDQRDHGPGPELDGEGLRHDPCHAPERRDGGPGARCAARCAHQVTRRVHGSHVDPGAGAQMDERVQGRFDRAGFQAGEAPTKVCGTLRSHRGRAERLHEAEAKRRRERF